MPTQSMSDAADFGRAEGRAVAADLGCGTVRWNTDALLLPKASKAAGIIDRFAGCFADRCDPDRIEFTIERFRKSVKRFSDKKRGKTKT